MGSKGKSRKTTTKAGDGKRVKKGATWVTVEPNILKSGARYYVRLIVNGRETRRAAGPKIENARKLLALMRDGADRERAGLPAPPGAAPTLAEWAPEYLRWAERKGKRSLPRDQWCMKQLVERFGTRRLSDLERPLVEKYMGDELKQGRVKAATINRQIALLRKALSLAVEMERLPVNPLRGVAMFKETAQRRPILSDADEAALLAALTRDWHRLLVRLALATGAREGELLALRWGDIDFDRKRSQASGDGEAPRKAALMVIADSKGGESREVPLHGSIAAELWARRGHPAALVFCHADGSPYSAHAVVQWFAHAIAKVGLRVKVGGDRKDSTGKVQPPDWSPFHFHDLRHVAASRMVAAGVTLPIIKAILGHSDLSTTLRYVHADWTSMVAAMETLDRKIAPRPPQT